MRIVLLAFYFAEYTIELANALCESQEVILMLPENLAKHYSAFINKDVKVNSFRYPRLRYPNSPWICYKIMRDICEISPDVLHLQEGHLWFNAVLAFFKPKFPLITTIHDVNSHLGEHDFYPESFRKILLENSSLFIVHGENIKKSFMEKYAIRQDKIEVIPHGILSFYKRFIKKSAQEEKHTILFFGRIWEYKGLRYLIEAEPLISEVIPDIKIIVAGRGENLKKYMNLMVHKEKFVIYNDYISNQKVAELFQQAAIVVLPYVEASQSGVIPMAYSFAKPIVATDVGSIPEVVEEGITGFLVPPRDCKKLSQAIIRILQNDNLRKEMGENAFKTAQGKLAWSTIAGQTLLAYQKAIK